MSRKLAELLLEANLISKDQLKDADVAIDDSPGLSYYLYFARKGIVEEKKLTEIASKRYRIPYFDLDKFEMQPETIQIFKPEHVQKYRMIPVEKSDDTLVVAIEDPQSIKHIDDAKFLTQMNIEPILTTSSAFSRAMDKYYGGAKDMESLEAEIKEGLKEYKKLEGGTDAGSDEVDVIGGGSESYYVDAESRVPALKLVNQVLMDSIRRKASDIHIENYEDKFRIRMRIDGSLVQTIIPPKELHVPSIARIKIMARMDISERRLPQDGRIKIQTQNGNMDFRVNSMPTVTGEKIVLRSLDRSSLKTDINEVGFDSRDLEKFNKAIHSSNGIVLVTGPTGSGKTTTLYSGITTLNKVSENISTAEDPVEFNLEGINQVQMHPEIGLDFSKALRAFMRQDPDIILVGEIRDKETAEIAVQASLTGHLVFSTLHTNDAVSSVTRLVNMGIEDFLLIASLKLVVAQRLLRRLCENCKEEVELSKEKLEEYKITSNGEEAMHVYTAKGCKRCANIGYSGRTPVFEVLDFTKRVKAGVTEGLNAVELKKLAMEEGMRTLRMHAFTKVASGEVSLEEALAKTETD